MQPSASKTSFARSLAAILEAYLGQRFAVKLLVTKAPGVPGNSRQSLRRLPDGRLAGQCARERAGVFLSSRVLFFQGAAAGGRLRRSRLLTGVWIFTA